MGAETNNIFSVISYRLVYQIYVFIKIFLKSSLSALCIFSGNDIIFHWEGNLRDKNLDIKMVYGSPKDCGT